MSRDESSDAVQPALSAAAEDRPATTSPTPEITGRNERMVEYRFKWLRRDQSEPDDRRLAPHAFVWGPHEVAHLTWRELKRSWRRIAPRICPNCRGALIRFSERFGEERPADREVTGLCVHCGIEARWRELRGRLAIPTLDLKKDPDDAGESG